MRRGEGAWKEEEDFTPLPNLLWLTPRHPSLLLPESQTEKWDIPGATWEEEFSGTDLRAREMVSPRQGRTPTPPRYEEGCSEEPKDGPQCCMQGAGSQPLTSDPFLCTAPKRLPHLSPRSRGRISHPDSPYPSNRIGTSRFLHLAALAQPLIGIITRGSDGYEDLLRPLHLLSHLTLSRQTLSLLMAPFTDEARRAGG